MSEKRGLNGFVDTNQGAIWEPKQTGSKKNKDYQELQPTDASYVIGYYLGSKQVETSGGKTSLLHTLRVIEVGDDNHVNGEMINNEVGIWGSGVLDSAIAKNIAVGQAVAIVWEGKEMNPKQGTNPYHKWKVMHNPSIEPLKMSAMNLDAPVKSSEGVPAGAPAQQNTPEPVAQKVSVDDEDDDDLPF